MRPQPALGASAPAADAPAAAGAPTAALVPVAAPAAAAGAAAGPAATGATAASLGRMSRAQRMAYCESLMRLRLGQEDNRVKVLTEGILVSFLPTALDVMLPAAEDPLLETDMRLLEVRRRCRRYALLAALSFSAVCMLTTIHGYQLAILRVLLVSCVCA